MARADREPPALAAADAAELARWWSDFRATGGFPAGFEPVQQRLIRSVHRARLPSGPVFVKSMTFPRWKDRRRYLLRPLPARHEARLCAATAAAGIRCPEVVAVRVARRWLLPWRSWLVTRALPVAPGAGAPPLTAQAAIAARLLAAGIVHRDLHADNFVALADGEVAVLDLQSASVADRRLDDTPHRLAAAARLVRDLPAAAADALREGGLLTTAAEVAEVVARAAHARARYARSRVRRCLTESTEFRRRVRWHGVEHSFRGSWPAGRWIRGGRELDECWLGQNANRLFGSRSPVFWAFFRKWWWLGGGRALYVPEACREAGLEQEIAVARSGFAVPGGRMQSEGANQDGD